MQITRVDNRKIGKGMPGEITRGLLNSFREKYVRPYY
jgi:hypothetical protein